VYIPDVQTRRCHVSYTALRATEFTTCVKILREVRDLFDSRRHSKWSLAGTGHRAVCLFRTHLRPPLSLLELVASASVGGRRISAELRLWRRGPWNNSSCTTRACNTSMTSAHLSTYLQCTHQRIPGRQSPTNNNARRDPASRYHSVSGKGAEYCDERVCLCICPSESTYPELHIKFSPNFLTMLPITMARSSCGLVAMCCVLPVLWMTSYFNNGTYTI